MSINYHEAGKGRLCLASSQDVLAQAAIIFVCQGCMSMLTLFFSLWQIPTCWQLNLALGHGLLFKVNKRDGEFLLALGDDKFRSTVET